MGYLIELITVQDLNFPGHSIPKTMLMLEFKSGWNGPPSKETEGRKNLNKTPIVQEQPI